MHFLKSITFASTILVSICCTSCGVDESTLQSIEVTKAPTKTVYVVGEKFDPKGMEVTGFYSENKQQVITKYTYSPNEELQLTDKKITISYNGKECTQRITVRNGSTPPDPGDYYSTITDDMSGDALVSALKSIISKNVSVSYDWSRYEDADEDINNSANITTIYARTSLKKTAHVSNNKGWNREHSFPQSKISGNAEKDNHMIFASDCKVNGTRSNDKLGEVSGSPNVKDSYGNSTPCKSNGSLFDPGDTIARGMVARATMYAAVMYGLSVTSNFESYDTLMKWHLEYSPEECDYHRNEAVYKNQKNRNPFVDHPEYACRIWGTHTAATRELCGM